MPIDIATQNSPGWWLDRLLKKLDAERANYNLLDSYYRGENVLPVHADKSVKVAYQRLMALSRTNFAELVVEAVRERMIRVGFRTGADGDDLGDKEAWRIVQANSLDADGPLVDRASLSMGMGYLIVGGVDPEIGAPLITPEDPREVTTISVPGRRRKVAAALKVFCDDFDGVDRAFLYLPGFVAMAVRPKQDQLPINDVSAWEWDAPPIRSLPISRIPVVPFPNRADMHGRTQAEFEPHLSLLDRINYTILHGLEVMTLQAFRQRAVKGVPTHDAEGNEVDYDDIFSMDPGAIWHLPATAELWESGVVDLGPIRMMARDQVQDLAAVTRTPLSYLTPDAANGSAEGASLTREGLIFKVRDRIGQASESWEDAMSIAFEIAGDNERASRADMEVLWAPPDMVSLAERHDANVKAKAGDVPWRTRMTDILGFSPQQVARMEAERAAESLMAPEPVPVVA